jgi:spore coat polysaccharide biosynthesis protein SpsF (cytidylyltransferase family)
VTRTVVIAQARMSSTRLPGKTLLELGGIPVVDRVVERARESELADGLWVATTTDPSDDVLAEHLRGLGVPYIRGPLDDVLERYVMAAREACADTVVRITCDCPLIDPGVIDQTIAAFRDAPEVDYCSNTLVRTYPIGMDTEVFSADALARAHAEAREPHEREHVTPYIYQHPGVFSLRNVCAPEWATWPELRLTLDEPADLDMLEAIVALAPSSGLRLKDVLRVLHENPSVAGMNAHVVHRHTLKPGSPGGRSS